MSRLYPHIEPHRNGLLDVGDGNVVYWETCGNPDGKPVVVLHGGPGSGCAPVHRRFFDPQRYRIVLFDQRNCGRSTPHAADPATDLTTNTTHHLVGDVEMLRQHLGVDRWLVFGNSWGSTLALAYAQAHAARVSAVVLLAVGTTRPEEIDWLYHGAGRFHPEAWARFRDGVPVSERDGDLVAAYHQLLQSPDAARRDQAARDWCAWEDAVMAMRTDTPPNPRYEDQQFRIAFARIVTHYFHHRAWLAPDQLLHGMHQVHGIPAVLVHGRLDIGSPLVNAWLVAQGWPDSELVVIDTAGHSFGDAGMVEAVVAATDRFARSA